MNQTISKGKPMALLDKAIQQKLIKIYKVFNDLEETLVVGRDTPQVVPKLVSMKLFSNHIRSKGRLTDEQIDMIKTGKTERIPLIIAKENCLDLIRSFMKKIQKVLKESQELEKSKDDNKEEIESVLSLLDIFEKGNVAVKDEKIDKDDLAQQKASDIAPLIIGTDITTPKPVNNKSDIEKDKETNPVRKKVKRIIKEIEQKKLISDLEIKQISFAFKILREEIYDLAHPEISDEEIEYVFAMLIDKKVTALLLPLKLMEEEEKLKEKYKLKHIKFFDLESISRQKR